MHPSDLQLEAYVKGTLGPAELLEVDDHLAGCETCRAAARVRIPDAGPRLRSAALPPESHLTDAQVVALADHSPTRDAADHLQACETCARQVHDLKAWTRRRQQVRWWTYAAAAAMLLAVIPALWRGRPPAETHAPGPSALAGLQALSAEERQRVLAALDAGIVEPPASLAELASGPEVLMGASPGETFSLSEPLATVTVSDRPVFRWQAVPGAQAYTVSVRDEALHPVAESPPVTDPTWTPEQPLPRGRVYVWQVTARRAQGSVTAPAPPAPMAKFRVLEAEPARTLERLAREQPAAHLVLGILHAQAGARVEAQRYLSQVPRESHYFDLAERTRARLARPAAPSP
jgi:hypothetical protein